MQFFYRKYKHKGKVVSPKLNVPRAFYTSSKKTRSIVDTLAPNESLKSAILLLKQKIILKNKQTYMYISDQLQREIGKALIQFGVTWSNIIKLF